MILGPVSLIDCVAFCYFLTPQLILQAGLYETIVVVLHCLPFILIELPIQFLLDRYWRRASSSKSAYFRGSTIFEDIVIRCVRYAFKNVPVKFGRIFLSKEVSLPFLRWRMLRHGMHEFPAHWSEQVIGEGNTKVQGVWIKHNPVKDPDIVLYYIHGGGFAMGSCFFYLEFLLAWHQLLVDAGYDNPAIFALDYTLAPDQVYPSQVIETLQGYRHVLDVAKDASKVCVAGDSAGGTLILSLLLELGVQIKNQKMTSSKHTASDDSSDEFTPNFATPRMATLISPWVTLVSNLHYPSNVDYLDRGTLWQYGSTYAGDDMLHQQLASPGVCEDKYLWKAASPERGFFITYGGEEVFAPDIEAFVQRLDRSKIEIESRKFEGGIHAWPVASLFLSSTRRKRLHGLRTIVGEIRKRFEKMPAGGLKHKNSGYQIRSSW